MWVKNIFDKVGGVILFILLLPLLLIIGLIIKAEDGGKIFFLQKRLGKNKKIFKIYKFRTMKENAPDIRLKDGSTFNSANDPRVTKIGKLLRRTSLDELAQIINIIKGEMSFIGPRPDLPDHLKLYEGEEFKKLLVKPGITGYAQINGRNDLPWKERFRYDIYYAENWSILLDVKIILKTISIIFSGKGVNRENV